MEAVPKSKNDVPRLLKAKMSSRVVWVSLLISLLLHLAGIFLVDLFWHEKLEGKRFRARLAYVPKFETVPRLATTRPETRRTEMEYLGPERTPEVVEEGLWELPIGRLPEVEGVALPEVSAEVVELPKAAGPEVAREVMPAPSGPVFVDSQEAEAMELLRMEDMARVDDRRAVIIPDLYSRRDLRGFINFTYLRMDGVTNVGKVLDDLARQLRDYTRILARVRGVPNPYFLSEQLLKDPIHFMFPGPRIGGRESERRTYLSDEEIELLGRYLREGGFLFVADSEDSSLYTEYGPPWLREMIVHVHKALDGEGRFFEIPPSHPLYHSFYDFDSGFPGEDKRHILDVPPPTWYFAKGVKDRPGLWGVELEGELVTVFSNAMLEPRPATNVVVYALTRPGGLTVRRARPAWEYKRPTVKRDEAFAYSKEPDDELFEVLEGSLALVQAPLGSRAEKGGLWLRVDGRYAVELLRSDVHGLLLHNLPAGQHWIEVRYGGQRQALEIDLRGGRVLTVTFGLSRLAFLTRLRVTPQQEQIRVEDWSRRFSDLDVERVYYEEAREWLEELVPQ